MLWDIFVIIFAVTEVAWLYLVTLYKRDKKNYVEWKEEQRCELEYKRAITPRFNVSEYMERIEKAYLEILETRQPISQSITLWWGLDGLRMNEDGTTEWISRRKTAPVKQDVFYHPCQTRSPFVGDTCQSTQTTFAGTLFAGTLLSTAMQTPLQYYQTQLGYPGYYPSYLNSGIITGYAHSGYFPQMQNWCCSRLI